MPMKSGKVLGCSIAAWAKRTAGAVFVGSVLIVMGGLALNEILVSAVGMPPNAAVLVPIDRWSPYYRSIQATNWNESDEDAPAVAVIDSVQHATAMNLRPHPTDQADGLFATQMIGTPRYWLERNGVVRPPARWIVIDDAGQLRWDNGSALTTADRSRLAR